MKKQIYLLVSLFALIGFSVNVMGQDATHKVGEQHTFKVDPNANSAFEWKIFSNSDLTSGEIIVGASTFSISGTNTSNEFIITWNPNITAGNYYVRVKETATNGCSTTRYTQVKVDANSYDLVVESNRPTGATDGELTQVTCMAGANNTFSKSAPINPQNNILYYKVTLKDGLTEYTRDSWKISLVLKDQDKNTAPTPFAPTSIEFFDSDNAPLSLTGGNLNANAAAKEFTVPKGTSSFFVKVTQLDNFNTTANSSLDIQLLTSELKVGAGAAGEMASDAGADDYTYTRTTYPKTTPILIDGQ